MIKKQLQKVIELGSILNTKLARKSTPKLVKNRSQRGEGLWPERLFMLLATSTKLSSRLHESSIFALLGRPNKCFVCDFWLAYTRAQFSPFSLFHAFLKTWRNWTSAYTRARFSPFQVGPKTVLFVIFGPLAYTRVQFSPFSLFHAFLKTWRKWALAYMRARFSHLQASPKIRCFFNFGNFTYTRAHFLKFSLLHAFL